MELLDPHQWWASSRCCCWPSSTTWSTGRCPGPPSSTTTSPGRRTGGTTPWWPCSPASVSSSWSAWRICSYVYTWIPTSSIVVPESAELGHLSTFVVRKYVNFLWEYTRGGLFSNFGCASTSVGVKLGTEVLNRHTTGCASCIFLGVCPAQPEWDSVLDEWSWTKTIGKMFIATASIYGIYIYIYIYTGGAQYTFIDSCFWEAVPDAHYTEQPDKLIFLLIKHLLWTYIWFRTEWLIICCDHGH